MNMYPESFEEERLSFIKGCIENDTPRLAHETYPDDVKVIADIPYGNKKFGYDLYLPENINEGDKFDEAFLIVHGGAFVYGVKENNKLFGMHLARTAKMAVINMDYSLLPDAELIDILREILTVSDEVSEKFGVKSFHLTGDSAGGYLSFVGAMVMSYEKMREDLGLTKKDGYELKSVSPICGCYRTPKDAFPSVYYEKEGSDFLPSYMYDIGEAVRIFGAPKTFIITGEEDFLREDNEYLRDVLEEENIPHMYYIGMNAEDRVMSHIFPIPEPTWPESEEVIKLIIDNAKN